MTRKRKILTVILSVLIVATVGFIWSNSMRTTVQSAEQSGETYSRLKAILDFLFGEDVVSHDAFRKFAHCAEFFFLGTEINLLIVTVKAYSLKRIWIPLLSGLFVAVTDECIQIFSNRGASVVDVLIDFCGIVVSTAMVLFILFLISKAKSKGR